MKILITEKDFWINKSKLAIQNIKKERLKRQEEYESKSWWYQLTNSEPIVTDYETITHHSWNISSQHEKERFIEKLSYPHCEFFIVDTNEIDLQDILDWAE
jgi:hypothetical protein